MATVRIPTRTIEYVLGEDSAAPPEQRTTFTLQSLSLRGRRKLIRSGLINHIAKPPSGNEYSRARWMAYEIVLAHGVVQWDQLLREDGQVIAFRPGHIAHDAGVRTLSEAALDLLLRLHVELAEKIIEISNLRPAKGGDAR